MISPAGFLGATPTALVGRAADLDRLAAVLADPAAGLVTVTGPAGVGKSRLVMEFFRQQPAAPGGVAEVLDFGQVADAARCGRMLRQFRERCQRGSHAARADLERLGAGRHTVLLDHFEDVAGELAPLLVEFRRCCPQVRVVCVGTTRLGLYGERVVRLQPLPADGAADGLAAVAQLPAVQLFVQCARAVLPEFTLTAENSRPVRTICQVLGGLPFAIELAAAQAGLAGPELILERLGQGFIDLRRTGHHPYSRHTSLSGIVSWVFARLCGDERMLLTRLAVFEGPFTVRAAVSVAGGPDDDSSRLMERLIDKSVLIPSQRGAELSLTIPRLVRLVAAGLLAQLPSYPGLRRAHGEYFAAVASGRPEPAPGAAVAGDRIRLGPGSRADLLAAFGYWREAGDGRAMAAIADALRDRCGTAGQVLQCLRLTKEVLRANAGDVRLRTAALEAAGELAMRLGSATARSYLSQARDARQAQGDGDGVLRCLRLLGDEAYAAGDPARARRWLEEGLAAAGGRAVAAGRLFTRRLAVVLRDAGELTEAGELARAALAAEQDGGTQQALAGGGDAAGDDATLARYVLATIEWLQHDSAATRAGFAQAAEQIGGRPDTPEQPECLELLVIALGKWHQVTDWYQLIAVAGLASRLRQRLELPQPQPLTAMIEPVLAAARRELTAGRYASAWRAGDELSWAAALRLMPGATPAAVPATAPVPAPPTPPAAVADLLTRRELEVALLVADGLTNRSIAHRLGIAEWTVVNHLRKVMRKLDCESRVHVTRRLTAP